MPKYLVTKDQVYVTGGIWMPYGAKAAVCYDIRPSEAEAIKTREDLEDWASTHTGDFSSIDDISADFGSTGIVIPWKTEDGEFQYIDCMYPSEDE